MFSEAADVVVSLKQCCIIQTKRGFSYLIFKSNKTKVKLYISTVTKLKVRLKILASAYSIFFFFAICQLEVVKSAIEMEGEVRELNCLHENCIWIKVKKLLLHNLEFF